MATQTNKSVLSFRRSTHADIPTLLQIEKSVQGSKMYFTSPDENSWEEELKSNTVYLVKKGDTILGNISYEKKGEDHVYISDLIIVPLFRGRGFARQALVKFLKKVDSAKRVDLVTHPDNKPALNLYLSLGFVVEARKENYYGDGEPRLVLALQK